MTALVAALLLAAASFPSPEPELLAATDCRSMRVTGYVRSDYGPAARTFDGTSIYTSERIAGASWDIPIDAVVVVEGLGSYRVADRGGGLGSTGWVDVAVWDRATAYAITGWRHVCVYPPGSSAP